MRTSYKIAGQLGDGDAQSYPRRHGPQTTAWIVLSTSFAVFCILLVAAIVGGKYYYDTATVSKNARLSLQSGIVLLRDAVTSTLVNASDDMELREGDEVLVGQGARASITLFDGTKIQLYSGAEMALKGLRQSRFHDGFSLVSTMLKTGTARLEVPQPSAADTRVIVSSPQGSALLSEGNFGVEVTDAQTRISSRAGTASVSGKGDTVTVGPGQKVVLVPDSITGPLPEGDALVKNGDFSQGFSLWDPIDRNEPGRPVEMGQRTLVPEKVDGRNVVALRVQRISPEGIHNETGLSQTINKDVSDYQSLALRAYVKVTDQSLSGGGYMGYEYPMMIRVRYRDSTGGQIDWTHGFFAANPDNSPTYNGEQVPRGEWIKYNGDLMQISPRPVYVISVEVLGAGHTFDGSIANVELVGK